MPVVHIEMVEGRTLEQKRELAKRITEAIVEITAARPENVRIFFYDIPKTHMAQAGILRIDQEGKQP